PPASETVTLIGGTAPAPNAIEATLTRRAITELRIKFFIVGMIPRVDRFGMSAVLPSTPVRRTTAILISADGIVTHGSGGFRRQSFGRTFLHPMARLMAAKLGRYPNHFLAVRINRALIFGGYLPRDIQARSNIHFQEIGR